MGGGENPLKSIKNLIFDKNQVFNLVWASFEAGFELSVKNHADPYPQIMIWPKFINFHKNPLKTIKISLKTIKFH